MDEQNSALPSQPEETITEETIGSLTEAEVDAALNKTSNEEGLSPEGEEPEEQLSEIEILKKQIEVLEKRTSDKDRFISKIQKEKDELSKKERELVNAKSAFDESADEYLTKDQLEEALRIQRMQQEFDSQKEKSTKSLILQAHPDFEDHVEDIAKIALSRGADPVAIEKFKQNPYQEQAAVLEQYLAEAKRERQMSAILEREAKLMEADKKHSKSITKAASSNAITNGSGTSNPSTPAGELTLEQIDQITDPEILDKLLKDR
jgi:hypothetical protein